MLSLAGMLRGLGLALVLLVVGCGGDDDGTGQQAPAVCEAGRVAECPCIDDTMGVQTCDDGGGGWGECMCAGEQPGAMAPKAYRPDDVCVPSQFSGETACGSNLLRGFDSCAVPDDGLLVGCQPMNGGWCCF